MKIGRSEGGQGGRRGHSNMEHWEGTEDVKLLARILRRRQDKQQAADVEDLSDAVIAVSRRAVLRRVAGAVVCACPYACLAVGERCEFEGYDLSGNLIEEDCSNA